MEEIRVLILEVHPPLRLALRRLLESQPQMTVAEAPSGPGLVGWVQDYSPDVILLDLDTSREGGALARSLKQALPRAKLIVVADEDGREYRRAALVWGASAYLVKARLEKDLVGVVKAILR